MKISNDGKVYITEHERVLAELKAVKAENHQMRHQLTLYPKTIERVKQLEAENSNLSRDCGLLTATLNSVRESLGVQDDAHVMDHAVKALKREVAELKEWQAPYNFVPRAELDAAEKTLEGLRANTPACSACAESFWCGSTMHEHTCDMRFRATADALAKALHDALMLHHVSELVWSETHDALLSKCDNIANQYHA